MKPYIIYYMLPANQKLTQNAPMRKNDLEELGRKKLSQSHRETRQRELTRREVVGVVEH